MDEEPKTIKFVGKISKSGKKRLINIPLDIIDDINDSVLFFKVYLVPIKLNDF